MDKLIKMIMIIGMRFLSKYHLKQILRSLYRDFVDTYKKTYIYFLKMPIVYTYKSGNKYMYNLYFNKHCNKIVLSFNFLGKKSKKELFNNIS